MSKSIKSSIVLAEDLRAEIGGRFSIIGTIVNNLQILHPEKATPTTGLAVYAEIEGIKNPSKILVKIVNPSGEIIAEGAMPSPAADSVIKGFVVCGKFQGVAVKEEGDYQVVILVDDHEFIKPLKISLQKV